MIWFQKTIGILSLCLALFMTYVMIVDKLIYEIAYLPTILAICIVILLFAGAVFLMDEEDDG